MKLPVNIKRLFSRPPSKEKTQAEFHLLTQTLLNASPIQQMDQYIQHGNTTTLTHCKNVAWTCYVINEFSHLTRHKEDLITAALLHDFYLYDWHDGDPVRKTHGFDHPAIACHNAVKHFHVSKDVQKAIQTHMWPLNITRIPCNKIAILLCLADKYCALRETLNIGM